MLFFQTQKYSEYDHLLSSYTSYNKAEKGEVGTRKRDSTKGQEQKGRSHKCPIWLIESNSCYVILSCHAHNFSLTH